MSWVFRPPPWAVVVTLIAVGLLVALGNWQLDRAAEKRTLQGQRRAWTEAAPLNINELDGGTADARFRPVVAEGQYLTDRQVLVDNQIHQGAAGYRVLTPFVVSDWPWLLLVDRGWTAAPAVRAHVPDPAVPQEVVRLRGVLDRPPSMALRLGNSVVARDGWPLVLVDFDVEAVERRLQARVFPLTLRLLPDQPGVLIEPQWAVDEFGPERHLGYAVQWFALAAAVVIVFVVVNVERNDGTG